MSVPEQDWQAAVDAIGKAEVAVISCHVHPDGDALGSALALHRALAEKAGLEPGGPRKRIYFDPANERSKTPIEIIPLHDYYVKQLDFVPQLKELAFKLKFHPEMHRQILLNWLDSIAIDWPVSRRRFYGTEIPIWYCNACRAPSPARSEALMPSASIRAVSQGWPGS